jgi:hypothetical protein
MKRPADCNFYLTENTVFPLGKPNHLMLYRKITCVYCKSTRNSNTSPVFSGKPGGTPTIKVIYCNVPVVAALWNSDTSFMLGSLFHAWLQFEYRDGMPAGNGRSLWVIREPEINGQEGLWSSQHGTYRNRCKPHNSDHQIATPTPLTAQFWFFRVRNSDSSWFDMPQMCWTMAAVCGTFGSTPVFRTDRRTFIQSSNGNRGTT